MKKTIKKPIKKLIQKVYDKPAVSLIPSLIFFVLSIMGYSYMIELLDEHKVRPWAELILVMSMVTLMTISGILFIGLLSMTIGGIFRKLFSLVFSKLRKKKSSDLSTQGVNFALLQNETKKQNQDKA
jgi:hypothetical protein